MDNSIENLASNLTLLSSDDISKMNFYEACLYLEKLNVLDKLVVDEGKEDE